MATRVYESRVIPVPIEKVWATIRALDLKWLDTVKNVESNGGAGEVGSELGARRMLPEYQQIAPPESEPEWHLPLKSRVCRRWAA